MTNHERITNMSADEMAGLFYGIIHDRDVEIQKQLKDRGIDSTLIEMPAEIYISRHKKWLESEVLE